MKLKYYLRGLGIGILVTAAITGILHKSAKAELVKEYEQKLQLEREAVYSTEEVTSEVITEEGYVTEDNKNKEKESEINIAIESALEQEKQDTYATYEQAVEGIDSSTQTQQAENSDETYLPNEKIVEVVIQVEPGDAAGNVAWQLYNAGVIDDKEEFIVFLKQNGYDKIIRTGIKKINMNDDWDTIGKKLTIKDYELLQSDE